MAWLELRVDAPNGDADAVCQQLEALGVTDLVIEDEADFLTFLEANRQYWDYVDEELRMAMAGKSRVTFYLEDNPAGAARLAALQAALPVPISSRRIAEEDWANNWKKYYRPLPVGERLLVVPEWEHVDPGTRVPLRLDPGLIFGTGSHPTTRRCLEVVETLAAPDQQVLDLGCGSGILSIAALLLGVAHVTACDIDPKAPDVVRSNAALNGLGADRLAVSCGDVLIPGAFQAELGARQYDLILANIVADVIIGLAGFTAPWLAPGGRMVCAGIIDGREAEVEAALKRGGFCVLERYQDGDWHSLVLTNAN
ncbi:MAG: 50S ribosomal protein L11 methyltransferase [Oscillospiraceae bacterium]|nr:50S ribosomal protein L11 methyltransferase [Oscillospiraceae bacterium]